MVPDDSVADHVTVQSMSCLALLSQDVLHRVEKRCEAVLEAVRQHTRVAEDPVERASITSQVVLLQELSCSADAAEGNDVLVRVVRSRAIICHPSYVPHTFSRTTVHSAL